MKDKSQSVLDEAKALEIQLNDPEVYGDPKVAAKVAQKQKALEPKVAAATAYLNALTQKEDAEGMLKTEKDAEMLEMAKAELEEANSKLPQLEETLKLILIPKDPNDEKGCIVEVRAGVGGDEAALFADEIARMILRYAESQGFTNEIMSESPNEGGGTKEIIFRVDAFGAYGKLKFESGVHRVQRIPSTESQGRVHTSAVSVVVLPEIEEAELEIKDSDVRVDVFRSGGCGGQSVNTTDSAVRLTYLPTGMVVTCQDEKSQLKNKHKAFGVLRARLAAADEERKRKEKGEQRLAQIGSGDRSDKIRTYNFPQDRVTDHRIGQNFSNLPGILEGNLDKVVEALQLAEQEEMLKTGE